MTKIAWPRIDYGSWRETCAALHLFSQIVGKYRLAQTPWVNHSWHATLYVTPRGLTTGFIPDGAGTEVTLDLLRHRLTAHSSNGRESHMDLRPMTVAEFHERFRHCIAAIGGDPKFHGRPNEIPDAVPFAADHRPRPYDGGAVERFHRALLLINRVFYYFRTGFIGKVSPVHLFWGSFDLAVTRFSGRTAPLHPGGIPNLPDTITREAYSHEVSSAGFWPGGGGADDAAFYAYAYPAPAEFKSSKVAPAEAVFDLNLGEFLLPYEAVRTADDPEAMLLSFLQSTYEAAANQAAWDRRALERGYGRLGSPNTGGA